GVTRVSLGVQSLDDAILGRLGRLHGARGAREAFAAAREAGLPQVSVDLMYGLPGLDVAGWQRTVDQVLDWRPDHLSAYGLTLDQGSRWGSDGVPGLPPEDTVVAQYWALARSAAAGGYGPRPHGAARGVARGGAARAGAGACAPDRARLPAL